MQREQIYRIVAAVSFALFQACFGLFGLGMALINSNPYARTSVDRTYEIAIFGALSVSVMMIVGAWRAWRRQIMWVLTGLICLCWLVVILL